MIQSITFHLNNKEYQIAIGEHGVTKIFFDKEKPNTLVILAEENIFEYGGISSYIASKDYKESKEKVEK